MMKAGSRYHKSLRIACALLLALPTLAIGQDRSRPNANALPGLVIGQVRPEQPPGAPGVVPIPPYLRGIALEEAQQDAIFDLLHGQARGMRERMKVVVKAEEELRAMAFNPEYDDIRARELVERMSIAQAQGRMLQMRMDHQIYTLLNPEQRQHIVGASTRDWPDVPGFAPPPVACPGSVSLRPEAR
jgi:hypothetical protein